MIITHVLLKDGTAGSFDGDCEVGDVVTVRLDDKDGLPIEATGEVAVILDIRIIPAKARS
ncbi:MAG: hypothetical protein WCP96_11165 [Methylococcaceae bacterium]